MRDCIRFTIDEAMPPIQDVLQSQGMPERSEMPERVGALLDRSVNLFAELAGPIGVMEDLSQRDFGAVYEGEGLNAPETPIADIYPSADALALFACTLGSPISGQITALFAANDLALGYMLDAVASAAADQLAVLMGNRFVKRLPLEHPGSGHRRILPYSPGYCGWHISGQGRLFDFLRPADAGITLSTSYLMQPLKSVSGVLVAGKPEIHQFLPSYPFCGDCSTHACLGRTAAALRD